MPVKMFDDKTKAEIIEYRKSHNKTQTAAKFGCSIRTIGRIEKSMFESDTNIEVPVEVSKPQWTISATYLNIIKPDGTTLVANDSHPRFEDATLALISGNVDEAIDLIDIKKSITKLSHGKITIDSDTETVFYGDIVIDSSLTRRIIESIRNKKDVTNLLNFFEKLMENTSRRAVYELFGFLEHNDIEITEDGDFVAWKRVNSNYTDMYTGTIDNSIGKEVSVPRNMVDENPNKTCSYGLHVAAESYIPCYNGGQGRIIKCKVNPRDVVAVPTDYNNAKMRCCRYKVIDDVTAKKQSIYK